MREMNYAKQRSLLLAIKRGNHHFSDLERYLKWSDNTITRYLKELQNLGFVKKGITEKGRAGYFLTEIGKKYFDFLNQTYFLSDLKKKAESKEYWIKGFNEKLEKLQELKALGISERSVKFSELMDFVKKRQKIYGIKPTNKFTLSTLSFLVGDITIIDLNTEVEGEIKLNADLDKEIKRTKKLIEDIKKYGIKDGMPAVFWKTKKSD